MDKTLPSNTVMIPGEIDETFFPVLVDESLPSNTVMMPREMYEKLNADKRTIGFYSISNSDNIINTNILLSDTITGQCLLSFDIACKLGIDFNGDLINKFLL